MSNDPAADAPFQDPFITGSEIALGCTAAAYRVIHKAAQGEALVPEIESLVKALRKADDLGHEWLEQISKVRHDRGDMNPVEWNGIPGFSFHHLAIQVADHLHYAIRNAARRAGGGKFPTEVTWKNVENRVRAAILQKFPNGGPNLSWFSLGINIERDQAGCAPGDSTDGVLNRTAAAPASYLTSWTEIIAALNLRGTDRGKVRKLNAAYGGPILMPTRGRQPTVERTRLLRWWNGLERLLEEAQQREQDKKATLANSRSHGRDATVLPDIAGDVKKRRSDRKA